MHAFPPALSVEGTMHVNLSATLCLVREEALLYKHALQLIDMWIEGTFWKLKVHHLLDWQ